FVYDLLFLVMMCFFLYWSVVHLYLHSFPTRRSSDLYGALCSVIGMEAMRFYFLTESEKLSVEEKAMYTQLIKVGNEQGGMFAMRSEEHTSELQSRFDLVCRLLLEKKKNNRKRNLMI